MRAFALALHWRILQELDKRLVSRNDVQRAANAGCKGCIKLLCHDFGLLEHSSPRFRVVLWRKTNRLLVLLAVLSESHIKGIAVRRPS